MHPIEFYWPDDATGKDWHSGIVIRIQCVEDSWEVDVELDEGSGVILKKADFDRIRKVSNAV